MPDAQLPVFNPAQSGRIPKRSIGTSRHRGERATHTSGPGAYAYLKEISRGPPGIRRRYRDSPDERHQGD
jgi:hypothetical protein